MSEPVIKEEEDRATAGSSPPREEEQAEEQPEEGEVPFAMEEPEEGAYPQGQEDEDLDQKEPLPGEEPQDEALNIRAEDVDQFIEDDDEYDASGEPVKPPGAAALWGEDNNVDNYKEEFKMLDKVTRKLYKRRASRLRGKYEAHVDEYIQDNPDWSPKKKKKKRKRDDGERKPRKRRREEYGGVDHYEDGQGLEEGEEEEGEEKISAYDLAVQNIKHTRRKRHKADDGEDLGVEIEQMAKNFVAEMVQAAKQDREAVTSKPPKPAVYCHLMLHKLEENMKRHKFRRLLLENDLLCALRDWLMPYPNGSLPIKQLRTTVYAMLHKAQLHRLGEMKDYFEHSQRRTQEMIDRGELAEGTEGFCKTFLSLWKNRKESRTNKRVIQQLIQAWVRPLLDARITFTDTMGVAHQQRREEEAERLQAIRAQAMPLLVPDSRRERARVPEKPYFNLVRAPAPKELVEKDKKESGKWKSIQHRFKTINQRKNLSNHQAAKISLHGKRMARD